MTRFQVRNKLRKAGAKAKSIVVGTLSVEMGNVRQSKSRLGIRKTSLKTLAALSLATPFSFGLTVISTKPASAVTFNCPQIGQSSNCGTVISIDADQAGNPVTTITNRAIGPYDGSDDDLVGIINNLPGLAITSIALSGSGNGGGIFAFDSDGICTYTACNYPHPTGYEGPNNTFSGINSIGTTGTVNFRTALASGFGTYFSLEGSPQSASISAGPIKTVPSAPVPEPFTILGSLTAGGIGVALRRKRQQQEKETAKV